MGPWHHACRGLLGTRFPTSGDPSDPSTPTPAFPVPPCTARGLSAPATEPQSPPSPAARRFPVPRALAGTTPPAYVVPHRDRSLIAPAQAAAIAPAQAAASRARLPMPQAVQKSLAPAGEPRSTGIYAAGPTSLTCALASKPQSYTPHQAPTDAETRSITAQPPRPAHAPSALAVALHPRAAHRLLAPNSELRSIGPHAAGCACTSHALPWLPQQHLARFGPAPIPGMRSTRPERRSITPHFPGRPFPLRATAGQRSPRTLRSDAATRPHSPRVTATHSLPCAVASSARTGEHTTATLRPDAPMRPVQLRAPRRALTSRAGIRMIASRTEGRPAMPGIALEHVSPRQALRRGVIAGRPPSYRALRTLWPACPRLTSPAVTRIRRSAAAARPISAHTPCPGATGSHPTRVDGARPPIHTTPVGAGGVCRGRSVRRERMERSG